MPTNEIGVPGGRVDYGPMPTSGTSTFIAILAAHDWSEARLMAAIRANLPPWGKSFAVTRIREWRLRGWASPMHFLELVPLLPVGKGIVDLYMDMYRWRDGVAPEELRQFSSADAGGDEHE